MTLSCRSSAPLRLHLNPYLLSCSRGGRATVRHALRVRHPQRPHSPQPAPQQVRHPGPPAEALEVEEKEDGEVQADLGWCVVSLFSSYPGGGGGQPWSRCCTTQFACCRCGLNSAACLEEADRPCLTGFWRAKSKVQAFVEDGKDQARAGDAV